MGRSVTAVVLVAVLAAGALTHSGPAPLKPSSPSVATWDGVGDIPGALPPALAIALGVIASFAIAAPSFAGPRTVALSPRSRERAPPSPTFRSS
jgi:hypothetical protein